MLATVFLQSTSLLKFPRQIVVPLGVVKTKASGSSITYVSRCAPICGRITAGIATTRFPARDLVGPSTCLLYTSDAADEEDSVDLGGRRIIKKKKKKKRKRKIR